MYHSFLIHSSADGPLGCFHVLAMVNGAGMNSPAMYWRKKWQPTPVFLPRESH